MVKREQIVAGTFLSFVASKLLSFGVARNLGTQCLGNLLRQRQRRALLQQQERQALPRQEQQVPQQELRPLVPPEPAVRAAAAPWAAPSGRAESGAALPSAPGPAESVQVPAPTAVLDA